MPVLSEIATMTEVAQGTSLARFGDGELQIMAGEDARYQKYDKTLADELTCILNNSPCLIGVPHRRNDIQARYHKWQGLLDKYGTVIKDDRWYGSSFVSRADWVPWTRQYRKLLRSLWRKKHVEFVAPEEVKLARARSVNHRWVPKENAFEVIDRCERIVTDLARYSYVDLVVLSCGPTATVLADRLARKGIWAVDLGNFGKFL